MPRESGTRGQPYRLHHRQPEREKRRKKRCYGASGEDNCTIVAASEPMERPMPQAEDLSRSLYPLEQDSTLIAVIEMSQSSWLVAGIVPGVERPPLKKLAVDESALLKLLNRWREEAEKAGHRIERDCCRFEAGRDGFWLARWLRARDIEAHVIHASSVAVSREHRRAKTDRLDTELLNARFSAGCAASVITARWWRSRRWRRRMPSGQSRARKPRRRAKPDHQQDEGGAGAARHPRLQSQAEEGRRTPRRLAHARRRADPAQHVG